MSLDIGAAVNSAITWIGKSPAINCAVGNPFMAALVVTAMAAIVIMGVYHYKIGGDNYKLACRAGIYMYIAVLCVLYLHHTVLMHSIQESSGKSQVQQVYNDLNLRTTYGGGPQPEGYVDINAALRAEQYGGGLRSDNVRQENVSERTSERTCEPSSELGSLLPVHVPGRAHP